MFQAVSLSTSLILRSTLNHLKRHYLFSRKHFSVTFAGFVVRSISSSTSTMSKKIQRGMSFDPQPLCTTTPESQKDLTEMIDFLVPTLDHHKHKGQRGRIGVVGGSPEYTGAPYFAGVAALRMGADIVHVFCPDKAAPVIKGYNPDLIVHPLLEENGVDEICNTWLEKLHAVVIGPGLGRRSHTVDYLKKLLSKAKQLNIPIILDADSLFFVTENDDVRAIIDNYHHAILTPNAAEFSRLYQKIGEKEMDTSPVKGAYLLAAALGNVTIIRKGQTDVISNGHEVLECAELSSPCRCGGQGDVLSGASAVFAHWALLAQKNTQESNNPAKNSLFEKAGPMLCAAYAGCAVTRHCNQVTFHHKKYGAALKDSMTTGDMIKMLHVAKQQFSSKM